MSAEVLMVPPSGIVVPGSGRAAGVVGLGVAGDGDAGPAVDADRHRAGDGDALAAAVLGAVIEDRVVLCGAVVPDGQVARPPLPADGLLGPGHVLLQDADQVPAGL